MYVENVIDLLRAECTRCGGIAAFARKAKVTPALVAAVLRGHRPPRGQILDALNLELLEVYQRKSVR